MNYPLEHLTYKEFEDLVALICERILGTGTIIFSEGKDGGKDAFFEGKANQFPSEKSPWEGKIVIQAKHTMRPNASCSDSDFKQILNSQVIPSIKNLKEKDNIDYYLLFTNRKLSGIQFAKIEDFIEQNTNIENFIIGVERINLWLTEYPDIAKTLSLNKLLLPLEFYDEDLKDIILAFSEIVNERQNIEIPSKRDIEKKNEINELSENYFKNVIKKHLPYFEQIDNFLSDPINKELKEKYENTIADLNAKIEIHRNEYDKFEFIFEHLHQFILDKNSKLKNKRRLIWVFLHYMYYNCDIGKNE